MSTPSDDDTDPELRKYAPKWARERPTATDVERRQYVNLPKEYYQDRRIRTLSPGPVPEPVQQKDGLLALVDRFVKLAVFAALVALLAIFGKPLLQRVGVLAADSPPKSPNHLPLLQQTSRWQIGRSFPPPGLQRPLAQRRPQLRRHSRHRSYRRRGNKRLSPQSRNRSDKKAASTVPSAG